VYQQISLFDDTPHNHIVNVASVPQRSPFRYPGGKTWLIPQIRAWLKSYPVPPAELVEPFTGGGIVALTVAFEKLAKHVTMIELDNQVAAVWQTIIHDNAETLAQAIEHFDLNAETLSAVLAISPHNTQILALQTILKNRTNRGGILAPGAGKVKNGENGKGLLSRWYPETIARRIRDIQSVRDRICFIQGDGLAAMKQWASKPDVVFFIDPPYTASVKGAGSRLYLHSQIDHEELFRVTRTIEGDFLMTYDNAEELHELASRYNFDTELVAMKNTHHAEMTELLIGRNLDWMRQRIAA
jgi:DNA adenine methylase